MPKCARARSAPREALMSRFAHHPAPPRTKTQPCHYVPIDRIAEKFSDNFDASLKRDFILCAGRGCSGLEEERRRGRGVIIRKHKSWGITPFAACAAGQTVTITIQAYAPLYVYYIKRKI